MNDTKRKIIKISVLELKVSIIWEITWLHWCSCDLVPRKLEKKATRSDLIIYPGAQSTY